MKRAQYLTPVVTAFDAEGHLDHKANQAIYDHLIEGGIDGLVILGSTGEFFAMPDTQKQELIDLVVRHVNGRTKVYIGTACMTVEATIQLSNYALTAGADGVMVVSPYYFSLSDASIEAYFDQVADGVQGDIYLYNFPARTVHDLSPQVTLNLLRKHNNIKGFKDTVTEMAHTRQLLETVGEEFPDFVIYSGFDENFAHNMLSGGSGCIGGLSNVYPRLFKQWVDAVNEGELERVAVIQQVVDKLMGIYNINTPFIPVMKKAMMLRGLPLQGHCLQPLLQPDEQQTQAIRTLLAEVDALIAERMLG
jgi:4-hydroxy-tetrahydrodipicolinate synthase